MRIGEVLGLTEDDIDFDDNVIHVRRALLYWSYKGDKYSFHISPTKTAAGVRDIPMLKDVSTAIREQIEMNKMKSAKPYEVDGYSKFIFVNGAGKPYIPSNLINTINHIVDGINREQIKAGRAGRFPKISPHIFRHTFCTRMCENENNVRVIQEIKGHSDFSTTMSIYNNVTALSKKKAFEELEGKIKIV